MRNFAAIFILCFLGLIWFNGCTTEKNIVDSSSFYSNVFELYCNANKLDSNTIRYIKKEYLIDLIVNASKNEQLGLYHHAIVDLLDALRFDTSKVILFALARNFYWIEKYSLAFDYAFKSFLLDTNFLPPIELLAWTLLAREQYKEASYFSNKIIKIKQKNITQNDIKLHLEILDKIDTTFLSSINFLKKIDSPSNQDFINSQLFYYYFLKADTENQIVLLEKIFSNSDNFKDLDPFYLNIYFTILLERKEFEKAISKFIEFSKKSSIDNILSLVEIFQPKIKSIDSANQELSKTFCDYLIKNFPDDYRFDFKLLQIYFALEDTTNTYFYCKKVLNNENTNLELLIQASYFLYYDLKKKTEAIIKFQSFKYKFFDVPKYYNVLGEFYANNNQYDLAEEMFKKSISLDSNDYQPYLNLGWIYSEMEDWKKSDSCYFKSLELFPINPIIMNNFAYSLIVRDTNLAYAKMLIEDAIKIRPNDPNFLDTYGWYFYKVGDYAKAKELIEKSIEIDNSRPEPFLHLSLIYEALDDLEKAKFYFEKAVSIDPNNKEIIKEINKKTK